MSALSVLKYGMIIALSACILDFYYNRKNTSLLLVLSGLVIFWFAGSDFAYRWDAIQHVSRSLYYMDHSMVTTSDRSSLMYIIWGLAYRAFGESEAVTHLVNMAAGFVGMIALYLLAKELYDDFTAYIALIVGLTMPTLALVNKWAYLDTAFVAMIVVTMYLFVKAMKSDSRPLFYLSLVAAYAAVLLKVEPGIVLYPVMLAGLYLYKRLDKKRVAALAIAFVVSFATILYMMYWTHDLGGLMGSTSDYSIVTPLNLGAGFILVWLGMLNHETQQLLYAGLLLFATFAFIKIDKKAGAAGWLLLTAQAALLAVGATMLTFGFCNPVHPDWSPPQLAILLAVVIGLVMLYAMKRFKLDADKRGLFLAAWAAGFMLFFMVNTKFSSLELNDFFSLFGSGAYDFRYIMPSFPPMILLFSYGVSKLMSSDVSKMLKYAAVILVSAIVMFNCVVSANLIFKFAASGDVFVQGYENVRDAGADTVYTQWPFYYRTNGNLYDEGRFAWVSDGIAPRSIYSNITPGGDAYYLASPMVGPTYRLLNFGLEYTSSASYIMNPLLPAIKEEWASDVYFGKLPRYPMVASEGFGRLQTGSGAIYREVSDDATAIIYSAGYDDVTLMLTLGASSGDYALRISLNGAMVYEGLIREGEKDIRIPLSLKDGMNELSFSGDGARLVCYGEPSVVPASAN